MAREALFGGQFNHQQIHPAAVAAHEGEPPGEGDGITRVAQFGAAGHPVLAAFGDQRQFGHACLFVQRVDIAFAEFIQLAQLIAEVGTGGDSQIAAVKQVAIIARTAGGRSRGGAGLEEGSFSGVVIWSRNTFKERRSHAPLHIMPPPAQRDSAGVTLWSTKWRASPQDVAIVQGRN